MLHLLGLRATNKAHKFNFQLISIGLSVKLYASQSCKAFILVHPSRSTVRVVSMATTFIKVDMVNFYNISKSLNIPCAGNIKHKRIVNKRTKLFYNFHCISAGWYFLYISFIVFRKKSSIFWLVVTLNFSRAGIKFVQLADYRFRIILIKHKF